MKRLIRGACAIGALSLALPALAQVTFYENENFGGRSFSTPDQVPNLSQFGFNDRASSVVIQHDRWELCESAAYAGRCVVLGPGRYGSLATMGMNDRISSVRLARDAAPPPPQPQPLADYHRRRDERLFQADVINVRAVVGTPQQRCWVEPTQVDKRDNRVPGAIAGALLGGILGHQIGGGVGKDLATAGGAVAGAAAGSEIGRRNSDDGHVEGVQRCETAAGRARPEYWDVTYRFRGQEHRMQTTSPPGRTVTVNRDGEPRV